MRQRGFRSTFACVCVCCVVPTENWNASKRSLHGRIFTQWKRRRDEAIFFSFIFFLFGRSGFGSAPTAEEKKKFLVCYFLFVWFLFTSYSPVYVAVDMMNINAYTASAVRTSLVFPISVVCVAKPNVILELYTLVRVRRRRSHACLRLYVIMCTELWMDGTICWRSEHLPLFSSVRMLLIDLSSSFAQATHILYAPSRRVHMCVRVN